MDWIQWYYLFGCVVAVLIALFDSDSAVEIVRKLVITALACLPTTGRIYNWW